MSFEEIPIRQFGTRYNLFLGGDREMVMFAGLFCFAIIFVSVMILFVPTIIIGILLWFSLLFILQRLAKYDPLIRFAYMRHIKYQKYYPAYSSPIRRYTREYKGLAGRGGVFS